MDTLVTKIFSHGEVYRIARKFHRVKFLRKLIRLSFCNFIFADFDPIAIINDVNFHGRGQICENRKNFNPRNFLAIRYLGEKYTKLGLVQVS